MPLFDAEFLQKLEMLSLLARRVFRGQVLAQRRSRQLGTGVEFADHREYSPGDDFRHIDWNVYARHGELLLRRFQEEEDLHVHLFVDCSRSMDIGEPRKFDVARQLAAALGYIALKNLDRVSVVAFAGDVLATLPALRGKDRVLSLLRFLEELTPQQSDTDLRRTVSTFLQQKNRAGLSIVITDFFDRQGVEHAFDRLRFHGHEPQALQVFATADADPSLLGDVELEDVESGDRRKVTITESVLRRYREAFVQHQEKLQRYCLRHGLACTCASSDVPFDELVLRMLRLGRMVS